MTQDPVTQPVRTRHRSKPKEGRIARLWRETPELFWLLLAIAGLVLLTAYSQVRSAMLRAANRAADTVAPATQSVSERLKLLFENLTPAEFVGFSLLLVAVLAIAYRLRWRLMHSKSLTTVACPQCGGDIHRVHRHTADRIANWFVPVRRYRCWNKECGWSGLRVAGSARRASTSKRR